MDVTRILWVLFQVSHWGEHQAYFSQMSCSISYLVEMYSISIYLIRKTLTGRMKKQKQKLFMLLNR